MTTTRVFAALAAVQSVADKAAGYIPYVDFGALAQRVYGFVGDTDFAATASSVEVRGMVDEGYDPYRLGIMFAAVLGACGGYRYKQYVQEKEEVELAVYIAEEEDAEEQRVVALAQAEAVQRLDAQDQVAADHALAQRLDAEDNSDSDEASSESSSASENSDDDEADENDNDANVETLNLFAQRLEMIVYAGEIPPPYKCSLTLEIMHDCVAADDGVRYERAALKAFFAAREAKQLPIVSPSNHELKMGKNIMRLGAFKSQIEGFVRVEELKYLSGAIQSLRSMFFRDANGNPSDEKSAVADKKSGEVVRLITDYVGLRR